MAYRYRCGECGFRTGWTTESEAEDRAIAHYADRHHGCDPGGGFEVDARGPRPAGRLPVLVALVLLALAALLVTASRLG